MCVDDIPVVIVDYSVTLLPISGFFIFIFVPHVCMHQCISFNLFFSAVSFLFIHALCVCCVRSLHLFIIYFL